MSNGDRYYPKQSGRDAFSRSQSSWGPPPAREQVRTGNWPAQLRSESLPTSEARAKQRAANEREFAQRSQVAPEWRWRGKYRGKTRAYQRKQQRGTIRRK